MSFQLHPQLAADSLFVADLPLSQLRLHKNATLPWLLLVPRLPDMREIHHLAGADRQQLMQEIAGISAHIERICQADKINIGMLGNSVPQLHIHIVARYKHDPAWPGPVWGRLPETGYDASKLETLLNKLKNGPLFLTNS